MRRYPPPGFAGDSVPRDSARVDWRHEMLVAVSYPLWDADDNPGFNRAEVRAD